MKNKSFGRFPREILCTFLCTFRSRSRLIEDAKWPVLLMWGGGELFTPYFQLFFPYIQTVHTNLTSTRLACQTTWNNREMIPETLSYIFRRCSCCCRRGRSSYDSTQFFIMAVNGMYPPKLSRTCSNEYVTRKKWHHEAEMWRKAESKVDFAGCHPCYKRFFYGVFQFFLLLKKQHIQTQIQSLSHLGFSNLQLGITEFSAPAIAWWKFICDLREATLVSWHAKKFQDVCVV